MRYWIVFLLAALARDSSAEESRIINGQNAEPGQFPYQVMLLITMPEGRALCGGSVLCDQWILTAGHCVENASSFEVHMGAISLRNRTEEGRVVMNATEYIRHEGYNRQTITNDVAVIKLPQRITFNDRIQPVQLPTGHDDYNRQMAVVSGWGKTSDYGGPASRLQYANLRVIKNNECSLPYPGIVQNSTLCCWDRRMSTCQGDSGGPLVLESDRTLIGVVSFGHAIGCEKRLPVAFARVTEFADWIREKTGMPSPSEQTSTESTTT